MVKSMGSVRAVKSKARLSAKRPSEKRLAFIDFRLAYGGTLRRSTLTDEFDISPQQATKDIKAYTELAEHNMIYSMPQKAYVSTDDYRPIFKSTNARTFLRRLALVATGGRRYKNWVNLKVPVAITKAPTRLASDAVLNVVLQAIDQNKSFMADYVSINSGSKKRRIIIPTALASDGYRWHVRGWDQKKEQHCDFVISRLSKPTLRNENVSKPPRDLAWDTACQVILVPRSDLPQSSKKIIAKEFSMTRGQLQLETTKAMIFYTLRGYGFDPRVIGDTDHMLNRSLLPLEIKNIDEVETLLDRRPRAKGAG